MMKNYLIKITKEIHNMKDKTNLVYFINAVLNKKYTIIDFTTINNIKNILLLMSTKDLIYIDFAENFNIFRIKKLDINKKKIDEYIANKNLELSYCIFNNGIDISNNNKIYPMHSVGKVFTGFLIILLLNEKIITQKDINSPLQLDKKNKKKLPKIILNRLNETTMLDIMTRKLKTKFLV